MSSGERCSELVFTGEWCSTLVFSEEWSSEMMFNGKRCSKAEFSGERCSNMEFHGEWCSKVAFSVTPQCLGLGAHQGAEQGAVAGTRQHMAFSVHLVSSSKKCELCALNHQMENLFRQSGFASSLANRLWLLKHSSKCAKD